VFSGTGNDAEPLELINTTTIPAESEAVSRANLLADVQAVLNEGADLRRVSIFARSADVAALYDDSVAHTGEDGMGTIEISCKNGISIIEMASMTTHETPSTPESVTTITQMKSVIQSGQVEWRRSECRPLR
jgi:hypothetical protein